MEEFTKANGQILLPLVELITQARLAVDEVIDSIGRQTIETILNLSAEEVAGPRPPGKRSGGNPWDGWEKRGGRLGGPPKPGKRAPRCPKQKGKRAVTAH